MNNKLPISVCIPVYNAEEYIAECINSVLSQTFTNFELLIIDDGSTDDSLNIIKSYDDPRIRVLTGPHNYIDTLNLLLREAKGKYIARMDADDRMVQDRLLWQFEYMEMHPQIAALGGGLRMFGKTSDICVPANSGHSLTFLDMMHGNPLAHATIMLRHDIIEKYQLCYEKEYNLAEDYRLWVKMLQLNLHLENLPEILLEYRISDNQVSILHNTKQKKITKRIQKELEEWIIRKEQFFIPHTISPIAFSGNQLTVIITFLNEGEEVIKTVASVRQFAGDSVDIIVINDHSYDGYDYHNELTPYKVHYFYNQERKGVAASRDLGVELCSSPYFLLLDGHMRFYDTYWVKRITQQLEQNDRCILCCQTKTLNKNKQGHVFERQNIPMAYGAYIPFMKNAYLPDIKWKNKENYPTEDIEPIPAILGAGYAASKRYWKYIYGLKGLLLYGCDEAYLSLKVWLEGGQCLLLKNVVIGHIYRTESPYETPSAELVHNYLFISSLLFPVSLRILSFSIARCMNRQTFEEAIQLLSQHCEISKELKEVYRKILTRPFEEILNRNRFLDIEQEKDMLRKCALLPSIANFLIKKAPSSKFGITDGIMNEILFFYHYAYFSQEEHWEKHARTLLDKVFISLNTQPLPIDFGNGICGIGWGLIYLVQKGFLKNEDIENSLLNIDKILLNTKIDQIGISSFLQGIGGVILYWNARILYSDKQNKRIVIKQEYINQMQTKVTNILQLSNNIFAINVASHFQYIIGHMTELDSLQYTVSISDWTNFPTFLAKNPQYWKPGIKGCTGIGLLTMLALNFNK